MVDITPIINPIMNERILNERDEINSFSSWLVIIITGLIGSLRNSGLSISSVGERKLSSKYWIFR